MKLKKKAKNVEEYDLRRDQAQLLTVNDNFFIREAYKSLRTNVMFAITSEVESRVIMMSSAMPGEGKSTTAANLAISLAEAGQKTLLIDCDMRKPRISRLMNLRSKKGLSDTLFQEKEEKIPLARIKDLELYVLTAGSIPPNPSELLGSNRMKNLLERMRREFAYIILDTPPINVVTDAVALSPYTDGTLLVVRSAVTEHNAVGHAVEQLKRANAKLLGFVLNDVERKKGSGYGRKKYGYGYSYGYGYEYGYGYGEEKK